MANIEWDAVLSVAPELSSVSLEAQYYLLEHANTALAPAIFGGESSPRLRLARIYLAAHLATIGNQGGTGAAGPVTMEQAGGLTRQYADLSGSSGARFEGSAYGQLLAELVRTTTRARGPVVL